MAMSRITATPSRPGAPVASRPADSPRRHPVGVDDAGRGMPRRASARSMACHECTRRSSRVRRRSRSATRIAPAATADPRITSPHGAPAPGGGSAAGTGGEEGGAVTAGVVGVGSDTFGTVVVPVGLGRPRPEGPSTPGGDSSPLGS